MVTSFFLFTIKNTHLLYILAKKEILNSGVILALTKNTGKLSSIIMLIWSFTYFNMDYLEEEEEELLFYLLVDIISKSLLVYLLIIYLILVNFRFEGFFY